MDIAEFIDNSYKIFATFAKPEFATDISHCEECKEHNDEVNGASRRELTPDQIGTVCWGISAFLTPEAMGYYLPRFIELALTAHNDKQGDPYMCLYLNQIGLSADSKQFSLLSSDQRYTVRDSLILLKDNYFHIFEQQCWEDEIDKAISQWST